MPPAIFYSLVFCTHLTNTIEYVLWGGEALGNKIMNKNTHQFFYHGAYKYEMVMVINAAKALNGGVGA